MGTNRYATRESRDRARAAGFKKCVECGVRWIQHPQERLCRHCWRKQGNVDTLRTIQSRQAQRHEEGIPVPDPAQPEKIVLIGGVAYQVVFDGSRASTAVSARHETGGHGLPEASTSE